MDISSEHSVTEQVVAKAAGSGYAFDSPLLPPPPMAPLSKPLSPPPPPPPMSAIISPSATVIPFFAKPPQFAQPVLPPPFSFAIPPPVIPGSVANMLHSQQQAATCSSVSSLQPPNHQYSSPIKEPMNYVSKKAAVTAGPIHPQRPVTVNLDFIKTVSFRQFRNMAAPNRAPVTTDFTTPPPPVPFVPAKQTALPAFSVNQPPPTIQQNTPIVSVASKENQIYSIRQQPKMLNNDSTNFADFSTNHVEPKIVQQNLSFPTPPPPFPSLPNFSVPPPSTSQGIPSQLHQLPNTNSYQMPPPISKIGNNIPTPIALKIPTI
uniref:Uncharacterized protein n=1 Tax=Ditylenchus dipsaci TaxID=166011 RepID=A0A915DEN6_9BILA